MTTTETSAGKFRKTHNSNQQQEVLELSGQGYDNFVDLLRSPATKSSYDFGLCKYMKHLKVQTVDELLKNADKPNLIEAQII